MQKATKNHANYTAEDYDYLKAKGYSEAEIRQIWDRDRSRGHGPTDHANAGWRSATRVAKEY